MVIHERQGLAAEVTEMLLELPRPVETVRLGHEPRERARQVAAPEGQRASEREPERVEGSREWRVPTEGHRVEVANTDAGVRQRRLNGSAGKTVVLLDPREPLLGRCEYDSPVSSQCGGRVVRVPVHA
jgi:hypothetical protein